MKNMNAHMKELTKIILETRYTNLDKDFECCQELLRKAQRTNTTFGIAFAYTYLGDYYIATNKSNQSGQYLLLAKEICQQHAFQELYMQVCHFLGIYYSLLYDELSALQYYLEGLDLARTFQNTPLECLILNNIAHVFQSRGIYDEAKYYYFEALERLNQVDGTEYEQQKVLVLYNLADLFITLEDIPMAKRYLDDCEAVKVESEGTQIFKSLLVCVNRCCFAAISKNREEAELYAENLLVNHLKTYDDGRVVSNVLYSVCKTMIELGEQNLSKRLLEEWSKVCTPNEPFNIHRLMTLNIRYHDIFSGEDEQNKAYREYFIALKQAGEIDNNVRGDGMRGKVHQHEMLKMQESIIQENHALKSAAYLDELTGVYNRRYINRIFSKLENDSSITRVGIVMMDVDYFKEYNDNYGHSQGDEVLISVAKVLSKFFNPDVLPGRYGGDEFICICLNQEDGDIECFIESVYAEIALLSIAHEKSRCSAVITLSAGYSSIEAAGGVNTDTLLVAADRALYDSKVRGRNQWSKQS